MAAISSVDITYRTGGTTSLTDTGGEETRTYLVTTDSVNTSKAEIFAATGVGFFDPNPDDNTQLSQRVDIRNYENEPLLWVVEVSFSSSVEGEEADNSNPLDRRTKIRWGSTTYQKFIKKDRNGNPLINKAGELFENVPGIDDVRWVISIEKNLTFVPTWVLSYENRLNNGSVTIDGVQFDSELLKVQSLNISDLITENRTSYRKVSFELHYRSDGWKLEIANAGYHERDVDDFLQEIKIPFFDENGADLDLNNPRRRKPPHPWPLDDEGRAIQDPTDQNVVTVEFDVYRTADFSVLPGVS